MSLKQIVATENIRNLYSQPPIQWVPGLKRPGREADHSSPTSAKVKKMWIYHHHHLFISIDLYIG
jgi:hypothetical protein